jgi:hypothetical protein
VKGNTLRIKDFKDMLSHIQNQGKERIARKFKRREEVLRMLATFKQKRLANSEEQHLSASPHLGGMKEAFEAVRWSQNPQGGEQTKNTVQEQAG